MLINGNYNQTAYLRFNLEKNEEGIIGIDIHRKTTATDVLGLISKQIMSFW
jgi:hypothetical protein